jgi:opacity protein-like surface antigen
MNNITKIFIFIVVLSNTIFAYSLQSYNPKHGELTTFLKGDVVEIDSCDRYNWCHLKNDAGYVKKQQFAQIKDNLLLKTDDTLSFLYQKRPVFKDDKGVFDYLSKHNENIGIKNYHYGYIKSNAIIDATITVQKQTNPKMIVLDKQTDSATVKKATIKKKELNNYFVMLGLGISKIDPKVSSSALTTKNLDNNGFLFDIGFGYRYTDKYFTTINLQKSFFEQIDINNYYLTANYRFTHQNHNPYIGVILGYSELIWTKDPIDKVSSRDTKSGKASMGLQGGVDYKLKDRLSIFGQYQFIYNGHKTYINDDSLIHKFQNNLTLGIKYDIK